MAADLRQGVAGWLDKVFWDEGHNLASLLTDNHAMVNDVLAPLYGVSSPGSTQLTWTEVPASERSGVLTQAGLLTAFAHQRNDAPVQRGVFVLDRLLCTPPPPAPPNVNLAAASAPAATKMTTRQMLEQTHTVGSCVGCHRTIDGAGFGFGNYDALGAYRTDVPQDWGYTPGAWGTSDDHDHEHKTGYNGSLRDHPEVLACSVRRHQFEAKQPLPLLALARCDALPAD